MELISIVISISSAIIALLLGIVGFFLKELYAEIKKQGLIQIEFNTKLVTSAGDIGTIKSICIEKHATIGETLDDHEDRIRVNEKDIEHIKDKFIKA